MPFDLNWVDFVIVAIIALSALIGIWRGAVREVLSCMVWVLAFVIAFLLVTPVATLLETYVPVPSVRFILAYGSIFLATLFCGGLVNILLTMVFKPNKPNTGARLLGVLFGAVRGYLIVLLLVLLTGLTSAPTDRWWQASQLLLHFQSVTAGMERALPSAFNNLSATPS